MTKNKDDLHAYIDQITHCTMHILTKLFEKYNDMPLEDDYVS